MYWIKSFVCFAGVVALIAVLFVAALSAPATVASAQQPSAVPGICPGQVLYGDDFNTLDAAWGQPDADAFGPQTSSDAPGLRIAADAGKNNGRMNNVYLFRDVDICVSTTNANPPDPDDAAGLIFWAADATDYYFLGTSAGGQFAVLREANGQVSAVSPWSQTPALRTGANATNILQVNLVGTTATIVLNGYAIGSFVGTPPPNGGLVGLLAEATAKGATTWNFQHLIVTDPTRPATAAVASSAVAPASPPQPNAPSPSQTKTAAAPPGNSSPRPQVSAGISPQGQNGTPVQAPAVAFSPTVPAPWPVPPPSIVVTAPSAGAALAPGLPAGAPGILYFANHSQFIVPVASRHVSIGNYSVGQANGFHEFGPLATDDAGNIFSIDYGNVVEYAAPNLATSSYLLNVNPIVQFTAKGMDGPVALALDSLDDIYVANSGPSGASVYDFGAVAPPPGGVGSVANTSTPIATIAGDKTGLTLPVAIALDGSGNVYVVNQSDQAANAQILEFAAGGNGNVAPIRTIAGDQTGLFAPTALTIDARGTIFVTNAGNIDINGNGTVPGSVTAYDPASTGNVKPSLTIAGADTLLLQPGAIMLDGAGDLWVGTLAPGQQVTNQGPVYSGGFVVFSAGSSGDAKPVYQSMPISQLVTAGVHGPTGLALSPHNSVGPMAYMDAAPAVVPPADVVKPFSLGSGKPAIPPASGQPGTLLFSDAFKTFDPAWGVSNDWAGVSDGSMVLKTASTQPQTWRLNDKQIYRNAEFHLKLAPAMAGTQSTGTFVFWATDFTSLTNCTCWEITIDPAGSLDVEELSGTVSLYESGSIRNPAIKPWADGWYDLDVALNGAIGSVAINGTQIAQFPAAPPGYGGLIGLAMQSSGAWAFTDLTAKAVALSSSSPDQPPVLGAPLFMVSFLPASNWLGYLKPDYGTVDVDAPQLQQAAVAMYTATGIHNGDGAYEVTLQAVDQTDATDWGGLVFWSGPSGSVGSYCLTVTPGGAFAVRRMVSTAGPLSQQFADIIPNTPAAAINTGLGQLNKLELVLKGNTGTVYINGTKVGAFTGTPPSNGSYIGLIAGSAGSKASDWNVTDVEVHALAQ